jgi:hypothetical protein
MIAKYSDHTIKPETFAAASIIAHTRPALHELLLWLFQNRTKHEEVRILHWAGPFFYFEVIDTRKDKWRSHTAAMRIAFTVDMQRDKILWNNMDIEGYHGNCFVRSPRWKGKQRVKNIPQGAIHIYKDHKADILS